MSVHIENKRFVYDNMKLLSNSNKGNLIGILGKLYHKDAVINCSHPINELDGVDAIEGFWGSFKDSFSDVERRDHIVMGGEFNGSNFVGCVGVFCATFRKPWLNIPPTHKVINIRFCETHQIEDGKIVRTMLMIDILDVIRQANFWPLAPSLATEGVWASPINQDGIMLNTNDIDKGKESLKLVKLMHQSLFNRDKKDVKDEPKREDLLNMEQKEYWHPKMMWYGPCGVGTTRGLQGFVDYHQRPFRTTTNNRNMDGIDGHYVNIGDGAYALTAGWPSFKSTHVGFEWLGFPATNKEISVRVMDFYLIDEGLIRENWVPIDILHILDQLDFDVFKRMDSFFYPHKYQ